MTTLELLKDVLGRDIEMLKRTFADFTDAEMLARPTPGANHTAWQMGHLAAAEARMVNAFRPGAVAGPPAEYSTKFTKETSTLDDASAFPPKTEILTTLTKQRAATITWMETLSLADLDQPGPEAMKGFAPTIGHMLAMMPFHDAMHMGQIQVIRRKLGRPVQF